MDGSAGSGPVRRPGPRQRACACMRACELAGRPAHRVCQKPSSRLRARVHVHARVTLFEHSRFGVHAVHRLLASSKLTTRV